MFQFCRSQSETCEIDCSSHSRFVTRNCMPSPTLDATDLRLLRLLQKNNRRRLRDLAEELGTSAPTCMRRMRRLESAGGIRAHAALVDPARAGYGVTAFVECQRLGC